VKLPKLNSSTLVSVNIAGYLIDWDKVVSKPQKQVSDFLRRYWAADCVLSELRIPGSLLRLDIVNVSKKIVVEVSPDSIHKNYNPFMHGDRRAFLRN